MLRGKNPPKPLYLDFSLCPNPNALYYARTVDFSKIKMSPATYLWASEVHLSGQAQHAWIYFQILDSYQWETHYWCLLWLCSSITLHLLSWGNKKAGYCRLNVQLSRIFSNKCWQARKCQVKGKALTVLQCPHSIAYPDMLTMQNHPLPLTDEKDCMQPVISSKTPSLNGNLVMEKRQCCSCT